MGNNKKEKSLLLLKSRVIEVETTKPQSKGITYIENSKYQNLVESLRRDDEKEVEMIARHVPMINTLPMSDTTGKLRS